MIGFGRTIRPEASATDVSQIFTAIMARAAIGSAHTQKSTVPMISRDSRSIAFGSENPGHDSCVRAGMAFMVIIVCGLCPAFVVHPLFEQVTCRPAGQNAGNLPSAVRLRTRQKIIAPLMGAEERPLSPSEKAVSIGKSRRHHTALRCASRHGSESPCVDF